MKTFSVSVDITMSKTIYVEANSEEEAISRVDALIEDNPYDYARNFSHYVKHDVICAEEED